MCCKSCIWFFCYEWEKRYDHSWNQDFMNIQLSFSSVIAPVGHEIKGLRFLFFFSVEWQLRYYSPVILHENVTFVLSWQIITMAIYSWPSNRNFWMSNKINLVFLSCSVTCLIKIYPVCSYSCTIAGLKKHAGLILCDLTVVGWQQLTGNAVSTIACSLRRTSLTGYKNVWKSFGHDCLSRKL